MMRQFLHHQSEDSEYLRMDLLYLRHSSQEEISESFSICGTVNDLACMGAKPLYLTCAFVIEEGFPMEKLEEIATTMEKTAKEAGVHVYRRIPR